VSDKPHSDVKDAPHITSEWVLDRRLIDGVAVREVRWAR
jgi:hypothetical protein